MPNGTLERCQVYLRVPLATCILNENTSQKTSINNYHFGRYVSKLLALKFRKFLLGRSIEINRKKKIKIK